MIEYLAAEANDNLGGLSNGAWAIICILIAVVGIALSTGKGK